MSMSRRVAKAAHLVGPFLLFLAFLVAVSAAFIALGQFVLIPAIEYLRQHARSEASALFVFLAYVFLSLEAREEERKGHNYRAFIYGSAAVAMALAAVLL